MNLYTLSRRATSTTHPSLLNSLQTHGFLAKPQSIANIQRPTEISATVFPDFGDDSDAIEKGRRTTIIPDFSDPDLKPLDSETPDETGNWKKAPNRSDGSE